MRPFLRQLMQALYRTDELMENSNYQVYANRHFVIEQCRDCAVPGYLIVSALEKVVHLDDLSEDAAVLLGPTLVSAASAVKQVVNPVRLYCAQFGEENSQLHFHIFPRTKEITEKYLKERPEDEKLIHGPVLLDWARERYKNVQASQKVKDSLERIRRALNYAA